MAKSDDVPVLTGKLGMRSFVEAYIGDRSLAKAVVETAKDSAGAPYVICAVGGVRAGLTPDETRLFAEHFEAAIRTHAPKMLTSASDLFVMMHEAAARAEAQ